MDKNQVEWALKMKKLYWNETNMFMVKIFDFEFIYTQKDNQLTLLIVTMMSIQFISNFICRDKSTFSEWSSSSHTTLSSSTPMPPAYIKPSEFIEAWSPWSAATR